MTAADALKIALQIKRTQYSIAAELIKAELRGFDVARDAVMPDCKNCDGRGHHGRGRSGKLVSCEICGGNEDRLGDGYVCEDDKDSATEKLASERSVLEAALAELEAERG